MSFQPPSYRHHLSFATLPAPPPLLRAVNSSLRATGRLSSLMRERAVCCERAEKGRRQSSAAQPRRLITHTHTHTHTHVHACVLLRTFSKSSTLKLPAPTPQHVWSSDTHNSKKTPRCREVEKHPNTLVSVDRGFGCQGRQLVGIDMAFACKGFGAAWLAPTSPQDLGYYLGKRGEQVTLEMAAKRCRKPSKMLGSRWRGRDAPTPLKSLN